MGEMQPIVCSLLVPGFEHGVEKATGCLGQCGRTPRLTREKATGRAATKRSRFIDLKPE